LAAFRQLNVTRKEFVLIVISNAAHIQKLNKKPKLGKEGSAKMAAKFRIWMVHFFG
jgi:hypothetical protein